ncbi:winged helix-turn-helix transcriptional regulator [Candidatus Woesearchaeota archaeon]|nr:winged helix-turn-helix transcriptional regulator [Candidatus Woesearchaeota archaeon]
MRPLTEKEKAIVLVLAKDFSTFYNARSLSKHVGMTPRGTLKALKSLEQLEIVTGKPIGKAIIYKLTFNEHVKKLLPLFLFEEAQTKAQRWVKEFEHFKANALILFGSALRGKGHNDIDVMMLVNPKDYDVVNKQVEEKNEILVKPIHPVWQTRDDLEKNVRKPDKVILDILKTGVVLKGQEMIAEVLSNVARSQ